MRICIASASFGKIDVQAAARRRQGRRRPKKPAESDAETTDWRGRPAAARHRDPAGPVAAANRSTTSEPRPSPAWSCSATAARTRHRRHRPRLPRPARPRFRSSPSASAPIGGRPTSASATWWRRPELIRATASTSPATCNPRGWPIATVTVELSSRAAGAVGQDATRASSKATERVTLGGRGEVVPVKFEITPGDDRPPHVSAARQGAAGRQQRGRRPAGSRRRNRRSQDQGAVDRQRPDARIHLSAQSIAVPPRPRTTDKDVVVDVWLQSASEGISQDANKLLTEFPATPQELFEYDCIRGLRSRLEAARRPTKSICSSAGSRKRPAD